MKHGQRTEQKSLQRLSSWQPMRWTRSLPRLSRMVIPVTRKGVKVRVTLSRMTLPLRLRLMQNSMSSCKFRMLRWARTFMTKKISLGQSTASFRSWSWFLRECPECVATMLRVLYGTSIGGVLLRQSFLSTWGWRAFGHLDWWPTDLQRVARSLWDALWWRCATSGSSFHLGWKVVGLLWWPIYLKWLAMLVCLPVWNWRACGLRCFWVPTWLQRYCLEDSFDPLLSFVDFNVWIHYRSASFTCCWRSCESRGCEFCTPGSESVSTFHLFHLFIDWSELVGFGVWWLLGWFVLCFCFGCFLLADQSLRSSCLPMTILAQLHDCHSCYDERSIDQKKNVEVTHLVVFFPPALGAHVLSQHRSKHNWSASYWKKSRAWVAGGVTSSCGGQAIALSLPFVTTFAIFHNTCAQSCKATCWKAPDINALVQY